MFNLDPGKLLVIAVVAIILLGPDRLPQVARQVGGAWRSFNEFRHRMESEVRNTMPDLPDTDEEPDGSFQPPAPEDVNGTAGAGAAVEDTVPPAVEPDVGADPPAEPTPTPIRADLPVRNPQPRGNVVPGDPTLN
jgi:sec-independent protein translocase protein TatB